ncbi:hypothetical protein [Rhodoferax ferrireducens]|uniref:hypothetical protein n=1 Tax=Rhodoferax ferrireducens TaxID=192843 RepID=UPI0018E511D0|nr:hypothetical protein [Rhodoferax ferrireducens]
MKPIDRHYHQLDTILVLTAPDATQEEIIRGIAAVWDMFNAIDVHPFAAAQAAYEQENFAETHGLEEDENNRPLTEEELQWADHWRSAGDVAMKACGRKYNDLAPEENWTVELDWSYRPQFLGHLCGLYDDCGNETLEKQ